MAETTENQKTGEQKREPAIRTMKSDISEYLKEGKPSLIQILTKEVEGKEVMPHLEEERPNYLLIIGAVVGAISVIALVSYFLIQAFRPPQEKKGEITHPASPLFSVEKTQILLIKETRADFLKALSRAASDIERPGITKALNFQIDHGTRAEPLTTSLLLEFLETAPPAEFTRNHSQDFFFFLFYNAGGSSEAGFIVKSRSLEKTLAEMLSWEPSIARDLEELFLGALPEIAITRFEDKTYRNIDYRFMPLSPARDFGIGYFLFPAKSLLGIGTSEEQIRTVINRLFEST